MLLVAVLIAVAVCGSRAPASAHSANTGDYAIPAGWFFTEAVPDQTDGVGFAVQDGHGAELWTALQEAGGVQTLGYPASRRFEWDGQIAQTFSYGVVLRWNSDAGEADVLELNGLPGGKPPAYARVAEQPPLAGAEVQPVPWSGWWWPATGAGPALYAADGPLAKYDQYVAAATGIDPGTRNWERQNMYFRTPSWAGHCNGVAAAAVVEPEPTAPVSALGTTFSVADLKGLLADYHFGDAAVWSFGDSGDLNPADFQRQLLGWVAVGNQAFVLTFDLGGGQVWSYPVYRFESEWSPDAGPDDVWHVTTTVWMADTNVPTSFVGTRPYPNPAGMTFTYDLRGDPRHPDDGTWTGASAYGGSAHPGRIWYPDAKVRNDTRDLVSPGLDRTTIGDILNGGLSQTELRVSLN
jgi:hypothetical protein